MDCTESESSSDESSNTENTNIANLARLLWHKVKKPKVAEPQQQLPCLELESPSTSQTQPEKSQTQSHQQIQQQIGNLLNMNSKKDDGIEKKIAAPSSKKSAYESRLEKDVTKLKRVTEPCVTQAVKKKERKLASSQWSLRKEGWGSMRMTEMTEERKEDLMVLNMRSTINPLQHYKHGDVKTPKFFQIGTVQDDHFSYHDRIPKKKRKRTLVDELMSDQEFKKKLKTQYHQVQATKTKGKALYQGKAPRKIKRKKRA